MTTIEAFNRLAAVGVTADSLNHGPCMSVPNMIGEFFHVGDWPVSENIAAMLMESAVLRRWPHWTVEPSSDSTLFFVYDNADGLQRGSSQPTRLAALVLAAEAASKQAHQQEAK